MEVRETSHSSDRALRELLSRHEAASWLGISLRKLDDLVQQRLIPSVKLGRRRLFHRERLRRWLESAHQDVGAV